MDDIKLYVPATRKINQLISMVKMFSGDICMSFGLDKSRRVEINADGTLHNEGQEDEEYIQQEEEIQGMLIGETYRYLGVEQSRRTEH